MAKDPTKSILILGGMWIAFLLAAIACFFLVEPTGDSEATYGLNRAVPITGFTSLASLTGLITAIRTHLRRKLLKRSVKTLGYSPIIATLGGLAILIHWIIRG